MEGERRYRRTTLNRTIERKVGQLTLGSGEGSDIKECRAKIFADIVIQLDRLHIDHELVGPRSTGPTHIFDCLFAVNKSLCFAPIGPSTIRFEVINGSETEIGQEVLGVQFLNLVVNESHLVEITKYDIDKLASFEGLSPSVVEVVVNNYLSDICSERVPFDAGRIRLLKFMTTAPELAKLLWESHREYICESLKVPAKSAMIKRSYDRALEFLNDVIR